MQIVIDIPEERYRLYKFKAEHHVSDAQFDLHNIIAKGKPLPKYHGRLIDADELIKVADGYINMSVDSEDINDAPTIIEAESEDKECR